MLYRFYLGKPDVRKTFFGFFCHIGPYRLLCFIGHADLLVFYRHSQTKKSVQSRDCHRTIGVLKLSRSGKDCLGRSGAMWYLYYGQSILGPNRSMFRNSADSDYHRRVIWFRLSPWGYCTHFDWSYGMGSLCFVLSRTIYKYTSLEFSYLCWNKCWFTLQFWLRNRWNVTSSDQVSVA